MRSYLIIRVLIRSTNKKWEDTSQIVADFIHDRLNLPYSREVINMQISRAHKGDDVSKIIKSNPKTEHRLITVQFVN